MPVNLTLALNVAALAVPAAVYFLVLGMLNSRPRPQLLRAATDFHLMVAAMSPVLILPALGYLGLSAGSVIGVAAIALAVGLLGAPRGYGWVIYNITPAQAAPLIADALAEAGAGVKAKQHALPWLKNVTVKLCQADADTARRFEQALARSVGRCRTVPAPLAMVMLLLSTAVLAVPAGPGGRPRPATCPPSERPAAVARVVL